MIEDKELNALFKQESQEHLDTLERGILSLKKDSSQMELLEEMMREAHSLKGAARMLDLQEIESYCHTLESILREQFTSQKEFDPNSAEKVLKAVDKLRVLSKIAVEGEIQFTDKTNIKDNGENESQAVVGTAAKDNKNKFKLETIRVTSDKLDQLMTQSSELQILQKRIATQSHSLDELTLLIDTNARIHRTLIEQLNKDSLAYNQRDLAPLINELNEFWDKLRDGIWSFSESTYENSSYLENLSMRIDNDVRTIRMLPLSVLFDQFRRMIHDLSTDLKKSIEVVVDGSDIMVDKRFIEELKDPIMHLLRNSIEHGIESDSERLSKSKEAKGMIKIKGIHTNASIILEIEDDGRGLNLEKIREKALKLGMFDQRELTQLSVEETQNLIFHPGFSTQDIITDISGRGVGLDVVSTTVSQLKGEIVVNSQKDQGTAFRLIIPQSFATTDVTILTVKGRTFALPVNVVDSIRYIDTEDIKELEGQASIQIDGKPITLVLLEELLGLATSQHSLHAGGKHATIIISFDDDLLALIVEEVFEEQSIVIKPTGAFIKRLRNVAGVGVVNNGDIVTLLEPRDLFVSVQGVKQEKLVTNLNIAGEQIRVLLAEDSMITRTQEKRILEAAGYEVILAVDGQEAWTKLNSLSVDAVVSDIMMPNLDGFGLTRRIRSDKRFKDMPIILVTTLSSDEDRQKGLEAGANAYISKGGFNQKMLLEALNRLVGAN